MNNPSYYINAYKNGYGADSVNGFYKSCSHAKIIAEQRIRVNMEKAGGRGYRVLFGNTFTFTAAWSVDSYLLIYTGYNCYMIDMEAGAFINGDAAASIIRKYEYKNMQAEAYKRIEKTAPVFLSEYNKRIALDYVEKTQANRVPAIFSQIVKHITRLEFLQEFEDAEAILEEKIGRLIDEEFWSITDDIIKNAIDAVQSEMDEDAAAYYIEEAREYLYNY